MTTSGDPSATGPDRPCGITALLPIGMSCRSRAEAFARSLQSRLRNLGSQGSTGDDDEDEGRLTAEEQQQQHTENTWLSATANDPTGVTSLQPLRMIVANEADSCFDFGLEAESPSSPVEECEYTRLIETATATPTGLPLATATPPPLNDPAIVQAPESGYVCSSPCSTPQGSAASSSHSSSSDCQFYDPDSSDPEQRSASGCEYYDCPIVPGGAGGRSTGAGPYSTLTSGSGQRGPNATVSEDAPIAHIPPVVAATSANSNPFNAPSLSSQTANGHVPGYTAASTLVDSDSCSESLPPSQSTESNHSTFTGMSSNSNSTLQDVTMEPLDDQTGCDMPDSATHSSAASHRMGNGHAIMPRGTVINADTELGLMSHGLKYEEDAELLHAGGAGDTVAAALAGGEQCTAHGATIQIAAVEKILHDCTQNHEEELEEEDGDRKHAGRRATMSSGDEDEEESKPQRIRRCSSLKTGKTPPGTPGRKKIVRFADVLGLDLTDVRTFMDEVPKVPQSAFEDLTIAPAAEQPMPEIISLGPKADRVLVPLFQQPGALPCFLDRVREKQVNLENAAVTDPITLTITGTVRVRNLDFHKSVYVRYTLDNWRSYADLQAVYAENSCDGFSDKFSFTLHGNSVQVGQRIEMAIRFHCRGEQFWDNNYDTNYVFQCLPITQPTPMSSLSRAPLAGAPGSSTIASLLLPTSEPAWCSNFY
ncbi:glycogen-binding subunit 76A-like [Anopheles stephensi]|uniref:CBM21 domain-containing protein n=2 Tax=Anopheles stephensi TaxID=30069 RepID=A0A182YR12_ANOST|nr:glycogen-binding subunit 76A isoform X1 [Anopheles stephensi]XP_035908293.1 glycogen-binding subunit 76A isoform X1 [Anopheles stephensi]XP_035908294.1 glycogen-binding subunit 76A isoform X1 [Anopheles stephensi]XP_035918599.1 glycogen-binding subunit 76A-like [Anopheles stephensi]XP_035918600.1 glycogen-binding subunit 76A-like [Anopheles stephensi]XP_035918601.1 glycogen-binding subunit 76A-like [Anopheles stephensi]